MSTLVSSPSKCKLIGCWFGHSVSRETIGKTQEHVQQPIFRKQNPTIAWRKAVRQEKWPLQHRSKWEFSNLIHRATWFCFNLINAQVQASVPKDYDLSWSLNQTQSTGTCSFIVMAVGLASDDLWHLSRCIESTTRSSTAGTVTWLVPAWVNRSSCLQAIACVL